MTPQENLYWSLLVSAEDAEQAGQYRMAETLKLMASEVKPLPNNEQPELEVLSA